MMRWMVEGVPDQVEIAAVPARVAPGEPVELRARVVDSTFAPIEPGDGDRRRVTTPTGALVDVPLERSRNGDGTYTGRYVPRRARRRTRFVAPAQRWPRFAALRRLARSSRTIRVPTSSRPSFARALLRQVANETGGTLLPARPGLAARGRRELHGERRHAARCTRPVGHADRLSAARDAARRRMVLSTPPRARVVSRRVPHPSTRARRCALGRAARAARGGSAARARARRDGTRPASRQYQARSSSPPRRRSSTARARAGACRLEPDRAHRGSRRATRLHATGRSTKEEIAKSFVALSQPRRAGRHRARLPRRPRLGRGRRVARAAFRAPIATAADFAGVARRIHASRRWCS